MVSKGQFVGLDWNRIAQLHSQRTLYFCSNPIWGSDFSESTFLLEFLLMLSFLDIYM